MVPFSMTLSDIERFSKIFSNMKHRAVSLRQLSFLLSLVGTVMLTRVRHLSVTLRYCVETT